jgi:hypothetical protein
MKWTGIYLLGYVIVIGAVLAALWKSGVLAHVSGAWIAIALAIALGVGIMFAVSQSGTKESISIDK